MPGTSYKCLMTTGRNIAAVIIAAAFTWYWLITKSRSTTITVAGGAEISLTVDQGLSAQQTIGVNHGVFQFSSLTEDVWKKMSNAGGPLYANKERSTYYVALGRGAYRIDVKPPKVTHLCWVDDAEAQTLDLMGRFVVVATEIPRGYNVVFVPVGHEGPRATGVKAGPEAFRGRCG